MCKVTHEIYIYIYISFDGHKRVLGIILSSVVFPRRLTRWHKTSRIVSNARRMIKRRERPRKSPTFLYSLLRRKEQSGEKREYKSARRRERGVTRGQGEGGRGRGEKEAARDRERQRNPGIVGGMKTARRTSSAIVCACTVVNARVRPTRARARARFYAQESLRGHAADRRLNHASYFTSGRSLRAHTRVYAYTRAYFSTSIYHPRVFSPLPFVSSARAFTLGACFCPLIDANVYCFDHFGYFNVKIYYLFNSLIDICWVLTI